MKTEELLILGALLVLLAEVTYLVAKLPRQTGGKKRMMFVDTSVLIDGRIVHVIKSGFVSDTVAIPRSVIGELQFLADNADPEKRSRARHGLDIVRELQHIEGADVQIFQDGSKAEEGVDERLLNLAKKHGGAVCTIDFNLNKVAAVENIPVCNINDLAKNLRMAYLPGEKIMLELVQKGQDGHQAVGYLSDGTMVVVEQASAQIGQVIEVEFIRSLQTAAGKMMFAKKSGTDAKQKPQQAQKPTGTKVVNNVRRPAQRQEQGQKQGQSPSQASTGNNRRRQPGQQKPRRPRTGEDSLLDLVDKQ
jgi:uncharacterized protein YacL